MKLKKNKKPKMTLRFPECKHLKTGSIGFEIITTFASALLEFTDITTEDYAKAEKMWNDLVDALLTKYDPEFTCGEPKEWHDTRTRMPYSMNIKVANVKEEIN